MLPVLWSNQKRDQPKRKKCKDEFSDERKLCVCACMRVSLTTVGHVVLSGGLSYPPPPWAVSDAATHHKEQTKETAWIQCLIRVAVWWRKKGEKMKGKWTNGKRWGTIAAIWLHGGDERQLAVGPKAHSHRFHSSLVSPSVFTLLTMGTEARYSRPAQPPLSNVRYWKDVYVFQDFLK